MKKILFIAGIISFTNSFAQLPPVAQAIYDEAFQKDSLAVKYALNSGAQVISTPDGNSFYVKWFPAGSTPSNTPLIVSLHGSDGYAFHEFFNWHQKAQQHGCGIVALQWYKGDAANDYFDENSIYSYIDSALTKFTYPSGKAFLHGFSRGSARSYAVVFKDNHGGKNYFCTTLSNAGKADSSYLLYSQINAGMYGSNVFAGKPWMLFCGGQDSNPTQSGCIGMNYAQTWLQAQGANVGLFIQDPNAQHDGFHLVPAYIDSVLNYYLNCYNGTLSVNDTYKETDIRVFPNPFSSNVFIAGLLPAQKVFILNTFGQTLQQLNSASVSFDLSRFPPGIYFLLIKDSESIISSQKLIRQ